MGACLPIGRRPHRAGIGHGRQRPASSGPAGSRNASSHNTTCFAATHDVESVSSVSAAGNYDNATAGDDITSGDHNAAGDRDDTAFDDTAFDDHAAASDNDTGRASIKPTDTTPADD
jgi:hypothetical protein